MSFSLAQIILAVGNSEGEETFWTQMLVLVILAVVIGIVSLIKTRAKRLKGQQEDSFERASSRQAYLRLQSKTLKKLTDKGFGIVAKTAQSKITTTLEEPVLAVSTAVVASEQKARKEVSEKVDLAKKRGLAEERDLSGGMEMLELDFLVRVVENTKGRSKKDVMMRKFSFNELVRREQLKVADSNALKVYALNKKNLYGKDIQCEAMKELAERTTVRS